MNNKLLEEIVEKAKKEAQKIIEEAEKEYKEKLSELEDFKNKEIKKFEDELKKRIDNELYTFENQKRVEVKNELLKKENEILNKCFEKLSLTKKEKETIAKAIADFIKKEYKDEKIEIEANEESKELLEKNGIENVKLNNNLSFGAKIKGKNFEVDLTIDNFKVLLKNEVFEKVRKEITL